MSWRDSSAGWQRKILNFLTSQKLCILLIVFGVLLRLAHFLENRSFRLDECWVATDINLRTFKQIFTNNYIWADMPTPPAGFLLVEKDFVSFFGNNEYAFRL